MKKYEIVQQILANRSKKVSGKENNAFAPTNIALCKYWGKRDSELNLPVTSSLSVSLGDKGAFTTVQEITAQKDLIFLNDTAMPLTSNFGQRLVAFLDLFRPSPEIRYQVFSQMNIPLAAGLASSACGAAALVLALDRLYAWDLEKTSLSILARIGSGSAARSIWNGFVEWQVGVKEDGMDSHGLPLNFTWPALRVGLLLLHSQPKFLSSREAMQRTLKTSQLYAAWPEQVKTDMHKLKAAIANRDFHQLGAVAEANALAMHATMMSSWPPIIYSQPQTLAAMHKIWQLRAEGLPIYFTQDAGANLKLLYLVDDEIAVQDQFANMEVCVPFNANWNRCERASVVEAKCGKVI